MKQLGVGILKFRNLEANDRGSIDDILRSDDLFTEDEVSVALELVDDAIEKGAGSDYWFRLAVDDLSQEVMGYICFGPTPMTDKTYDLYWIVTGQQFRGKGVARQLIAQMETVIAQRGGGSVRVETSQKESYGAARRLYDACEYPELARFPDFYRNGDDLVVFYKQV